MKQENTITIENSSDITIIQNELQDNQVEEFAQEKGGLSIMWERVLKVCTIICTISGLIGIYGFVKERFNHK